MKAGMSLRRRLSDLERKITPSTVVPMLIIFDGDDLAIETRRRAWKERYSDQIEAAHKVGEIIFGLDFRLHSHRPEHTP